MHKSSMLVAITGAALTCFCAYSKEPIAKNSDTTFLTMAAQADMTTAHLGQDAENRSSTDKLKDLGRTLVADHTTDYERLSEMATKMGDAIPKGIDHQSYREISVLEHYKGKSFDREFLRHEANEHEKLVRAYEQESEHGKNPDIKAYATKALPTIQQHLHAVQDLLKTQA